MNIEQILENMTQEEVEQLMATDFGADLEKQASAELAQSDLAEALYTYGAFIADSEVSATEDLSKEASAEQAELAQEIAVALEEALNESGLLETDSTVELHKEAQAAAGIIFQGYADQIEKIAEEAKTEPGRAAKAKKWLGDKMKAVKDSKVGKHLAANKGKYGAGAAGLAALGAGAYAYKKHHEKKASEITASELSAIVQEEQMTDSVIADGLSKLANAGEQEAVKKGMGEKMKAAYESAKQRTKDFASKVKGSAAGKHIGAHAGKYGLGAGMALGGLAAHMASKKKKK